MTISEIQQFMGMVNQLGKFTPKLAELTQPLRELLSKSGTWVWAPAQERASAQVKEELSKPTVLALYDPEGRKPLRKYLPMPPCMDLVQYCCRNLIPNGTHLHMPLDLITDTEHRYAQIEKLRHGENV